MQPGDDFSRMEQGILDLVQRLEDLVADSHRVPLTNKVLVDEQELYGLLDELRRVLPEELAQARFIVRDRDRILAEARETAERLVSQGREEGARLAGEAEVMRLAQAEAEEILEKAKAVAREIRLGADRYADEVLSKVEGGLERTIKTIRQSRLELTGQSPADRHDGGVERSPSPARPAGKALRGKEREAG